MKKPACLISLGVVVLLSIIFVLSTWLHLTGFAHWTKAAENGVQGQSYRLAEAPVEVDIYVVEVTSVGRILPFANVTGQVEVDMTFICPPGTQTSGNDSETVWCNTADGSRYSSPIPHQVTVKVEGEIVRFDLTVRQYTFNISQ
jgi:hypothetical protein